MDIEVDMMTAERADGLIAIIRELQLCDAAIAQYEEMGISFTVHDIEHREMRAKALKTYLALR
jgi:hypothetical protein